MIFTIIALAAPVLVLLEILCRFLLPKPNQYPNPQVRHKINKKTGYLNYPNQHCFTIDATANINSLGFRGKEISERIGQSESRVLCLGNSLTFGVGVGDSETYPSKLEQRLSQTFPNENIEVINAGVIGFTVRQYIPFLEQYLPKLKPRIVVLGMAWRDMHHHPRFGQLDGKVDNETWEAMQKQFEKGTKRKTEFQSFSDKCKDLLKRSYLIYVITQYLRGIKDFFQPPNFILWQKAFLGGDLNDQIIARERYSREKLQNAKALCQQYHAQLLIVLFPDHKQLFRHYPKSIWPTLIVDICQDNDIEYLDLYPSLKAAYSRLKKKLFIPYDITHYTEKANEAIAEAVLKVTENILREKSKISFD